MRFLHAPYTEVKVQRSIKNLKRTGPRTPIAERVMEGKAVQRATSEQHYPLLLRYASRSTRRRTRQEFASPRTTGVLLTEPPLARKSLRHRSKRR